MSQPNFPSKKTRAACDRCHSQKLRCLRKRGQDECERCYRLRTTCQFGPRASRSVKPRGEGIPQALVDLPFQTSLNNQSTSGFSKSLDFEFFNRWSDPSNLEPSFSESQEHWKGIQELQVPSSDWAQINLPSNVAHNFDDASFVPGSNSLIVPGVFQSPQISNPYLTIEDPVGDSSLYSPPESLFEKLTKLNLALYKCSCNLSSMTKENKPSTYPNSRKARVFAIDELFHITNEFVNVLEDFCAVDQPEASQDPRMLSTSLPLTSIRHLSESTYSSDSENFSGRTFDRTDEPTTALLFSTHSLLSTIYTSLLGMMGACIQSSHIPSLPPNWTVVLPNLQIGSLTAPVVRVDAQNPVQDSSMYMFMILMLAERSWRLIVERLIPGGDMGVNAKDVMWRSMSDKSAEILRTVHETKRMM